MKPYYRYNVAEILKLPVDSTALKMVLKALEGCAGCVDDDWNKSDPIQQGYAMAGEKRYNLALVKNQFQKTIKSEISNEKITGDRALQKGANPFSIEDGDAVQINHPEYHELAQQVKILVSGKSCLFLIVLFC